MRNIKKKTIPIMPALMISGECGVEKATFKSCSPNVAQIEKFKECIQVNPTIDWSQSKKTKGQTIADFMGYLGNKNKDPYFYAMNDAYMYDRLGYCDKWEWIMPVVIKIRDLKPPKGKGGPEVLKAMDTRLKSVLFALKTVKIEQVFSACANYVAWYNFEVINGQKYYGI